MAKNTEPVARGQEVDQKGGVENRLPGIGLNPVETKTLREDATFSLAQRLRSRTVNGGRAPGA